MQRKIIVLNFYFPSIKTWVFFGLFNVGTMIFAFFQDFGQQKRNFNALTLIPIKPKAFD